MSSAGDLGRIEPGVAIPMTVTTPKLLHRRRSKVLFAGAAVAVLTIGWLSRPPDAPRPTTHGVEERVAPLLEAELARRAGEPTPAQVQDVARRVGPYTVTFARPEPPASHTTSEFPPAHGPQPEPPGVGTLVSTDGFILAHADGLGSGMRVGFTHAASRPQYAQVVAYEPDTGLVLLDAEGNDWSAAPVVNAPPTPGTVAFAAAQWSGTEMAAPVVIMTSEGNRYRALGAGEMMPGMPVYDSDGALVAVAGRGVLHDARLAVERLRARLTGPQESVVGVSLQSAAPQFAPWFPPDSVIVADRGDDTPAARAGLVAGDVLMDVGGSRIESPGHFHQLVASQPPGLPVVLTGRRNGRPATWTVAPVTAFELRRTSIRRAEQPDSPILHELLPAEWFGTLTVDGSDALPLGTRVLSASGIPVRTAAELARRLRQHRGALLLYLDDGRERYFAVLATTRGARP